MISFKRLPYLQMPQTDGMAVMWETDAESSSEIEVYSMKRLHTQCQADKLLGIFKGEEGSIHRVRITGLLPSTS